MSPLDDLPITTGPTAVVKDCICEGVCLCYLCAQTSIATSNKREV